MIRPFAVIVAWRFLVLLAAVPVLFGPTTSARAQVPQGRPTAGEVPFRERTDVFRRLLFEKHFQSAAYDGLDPRDTVLVLLGDTSRIERNPAKRTELAKLIQFIDAGGAALVATDRPLGPTFQTSVANRCGFVVEGRPLHYGLADVNAHCYAGKNFCPLLEPVPNGTPNLFDNGAGAPPLQVATNMPARLAPTRPLGGTGRVLANLPAGCRYIPNNDRPPDQTAMAAAQSRRGERLLLLADHSIFINDMMLPSDNSNVEFTANCMAWLSDNGKYKKVLFIEDGEVNPTFEVEVGEPPAPTINKSKADQFLEQLAEGIRREGTGPINIGVGEVNEGVQKAENRDLVNDGIHGLVTGFFRTPRNAAAFLLVALTLAGLVVGFARLVAHGFQQQNRVAPNLARLVQNHQPTDSLMEQRNQAMFQVQNFWEAGRLLARQTLEAAGVAAKAGDRLPVVTVRGSWTERRQLRRAAARLWALAFGTKPVTVSPAEWPELLHQLKAAQAALAKGTLRLG